jgi:hypothetical protein
MKPRVMDLDLLRPQAGRYAQQRYRAGLKRWRARVVRPLRWAFLLAGCQRSRSGHRDDGRDGP